MPEETAGPYPGDGSNGVNALTESGIVRSDITSSFGSASGDGRRRADDVADDDHRRRRRSSPLEGAAVYVWHCDAEGRYSLYSPGVDGRELPARRAGRRRRRDGDVHSIYPACYSGRWPHIHYEVYPDVDARSPTPSNKIATSQLAMPDDANQAVFATVRLLRGSAANYSRVSLGSDNVFSDGTTNEEPTVTGDVDGRLHRRDHEPGVHVLTLCVTAYVLEDVCGDTDEDP